MTEGNHVSDDKPKKSWREIDAVRDRSQQRERGQRFEEKSREVSNSKKYRAALEALFEKGGFDKVAEILGHGKEAEKESAPTPAPAPAPEPAPAPVEKRAAAPAPTGGGGDPNKAALRKKIVEAIGRDDITRAVDKYLAKWPLPDDWEVLEQALEHTDPARVEEVMGRLEALAGREKPRRARTLLGKLRYIEETGRSTDLAARAGALRGRLA